MPVSAQAISVVVPAFNGAAYIGEALQSVIVRNGVTGSGLIIEIFPNVG